MCGIFGFVGMSGGPTVETILSMAKATELRGPHAFGVAWLDDAGRIRHYRAAGRVSESLDTLRAVAGCRAMVGHCRFVTQGSPKHNVNNHPHPSDGGWFVHNGIVPNYSALIEEFGLLPNGQCDSEVLGLLIEQFRGSLAHRVERTVAQVDNRTALAFAGLWSRPGRVVVVKRGKPLFSSRGTKGNIYFGTVAEALPGSPRPVAEDSVISIDLASKSITTKSIPGCVTITRDASDTIVGRRYEEFDPRGITDRFDAPRRSNLGKAKRILSIAEAEAELFGEEWAEAFEQGGE